MSRAYPIGVIYPMRMSGNANERWMTRSRAGPLIVAASRAARWSGLTELSQRQYTIIGRFPRQLRTSDLIVTQAGQT